MKWRSISTAIYVVYLIKKLISDDGTQDGMTWFFNPPEQSLPLILADKGFDVWIANTRGTRFSRKHRTLYPTQKVCKTNNIKK